MCDKRVNVVVVIFYFSSSRIFYLGVRFARRSILRRLCAYEHFRFIVSGPPRRTHNIMPRLIKRRFFFSLSIQFFLIYFYFIFFFITRRNERMIIYKHRKHRGFFYSRDIIIIIRRYNIRVSPSTYARRILSRDRIVIFFFLYI